MRVLDTETYDSCGPPYAIKRAVIVRNKGMKDEKEKDEERETEEHLETNRNIRRRDVMKAASGAVVGSAILAGNASAQETTFCGRTGCTDVIKPSNSTFSYTNDRTCVRFNQNYLDARIAEGYDTIGFKSGSCTNTDDGMRTATTSRYNRECTNTASPARRVTTLAIPSY